MFRQAFREVRFHPGRLVATLLAIALSVGFMSAVSIFMATQTAALGKMMALPTSRAEIVVDANDTTATHDRFRTALAGVPGVEAVEKSETTSLAIANGDAVSYATVYALPSDRFRWSSLSIGAWPQGATQLALSEQLAGQLKVGVGGTVEVGPTKATVSGITRDAPTLFMQTAYVDASYLTALNAPGADRSAIGTWLVGLKPGTDAAATVGAVETALKGYEGVHPAGSGRDKPIVVVTAAEAQHRATMVMGNDFDVMKNMLLAFSGVAAVVGMIIIANTFTILLAQRRRQIGLLRAVGASGSQVRGRFLAEAVVLGLIGSVVGIAVGAVVAYIGAVFTKASWFGLVLPWRDLAIEVGVGVLLTVLAAMLPALRATQVAPLEALQPVATSEQVRRASTVRAVVTGLLIAAGAALAVLSQVVKVEPGSMSLLGPVLYAMAGAMLITVGVLGAAPLYVPVLLRWFGRLFGRLGATPRLAGENAVRNPSRAAATATALMLATGLIVTLQIGVATAERTVLGEIEQRMPIDLTLGAVPYGSGAPGQGEDMAAIRIAPATLDKIAKLPNIRTSAVLKGAVVPAESEGGGENLLLLGADPAMRQIAPAIDAGVADGVVLTSSRTFKNGSTVTYTPPGREPVKLTVKQAAWVPMQQGIVSAATLDKLTADPQPLAVWMKLTDKSQMGATVKGLEPLLAATGPGGMPQIMPGGSAMESFMVQEVLRILLLITTALLGVAVLIALIGVGNTLGLSVIERARESALLRALGMQRASLRRMLLVESLLLAGTGILVGVAAGVFFGWLGMSALMRQSSTEAPLLLGVDWVQTLGMIAIAVAAAALASVLPGRRAANATPTEALAAD